MYEVDLTSTNLICSLTLPSSFDDPVQKSQICTILLNLKLRRWKISGCSWVSSGGQMVHEDQLANNETKTKILWWLLLLIIREIT